MMRCEHGTLHLPRLFSRALRSLAARDANSIGKVVTMPSMQRIRFLAALTWLCADYHSGQWSRGYRLMCKCQAALARYGVAWYRIENKGSVRRLYNRLEKRSDLIAKL
jgi:hypothetical protein